MPTRDIVVIGASEGGTDSLARLVSSFPPNLAAAVFVVLHTEALRSTRIDEILSKAGPLPAEFATEGAPIQHGRILIAPPNRHLVIATGHVHLDTGPKENNRRPAINVLFRSAARTYGSRVIGIVLSGALDDGTVGLWEIKRNGGVAIVQDLDEAAFPDMPRNALNNVRVDYNVTLNEMAGILSDWSKPSPESPESAESKEPMPWQLVNVTCPECRGPLEEFHHEHMRDFRCRVGHHYSSDSLLSAQADTQERSLWASVLALEEGADLTEQLANDMPPERRAAALQEAEMRRNMSRQIREMIETLAETAPAAQPSGNGGGSAQAPKSQRS